MFKRFYNWVIYGDCSQEPSDNAKFLKGLHPMSKTKDEFTARSSQEGTAKNRRF